MDNLGYCCINQTLRKKNVYTGRSLIRRTFTIEKASQLALQNCIDLLSIVQWNIDNNINVFRISSDLFPRITDNINRYNFNQLSTEKQICSVLAQVGKLAYDNNIILSCHPGPYTVLGSDKDNVINNSIDEINMHVLIGKLLRSDAPKLQFHINFHVGNKFSPESGERFCANFHKLDDYAKSMITIENDDKANCWSINKLYNHIHRRIGVPLTFDYHHSQFSREPELSHHDEFMLAKITWENRGCLQEVHYSSSENNTPKHSDYILETIPDWLTNDPDIYIHLEAKQKELAVLKYRKF